MRISPELRKSRLLFSARPYNPPEAKRAPEVTIAVNHRPGPRIQLGPPALKLRKIEVPLNLSDKDLAQPVEIEFSFKNIASPKSLGLSPDIRRLGLAFMSVTATTGTTVKK